MHDHSERNQLFPIFLKAERLHFLIVGGGEVGLEKVSFLLKSSPQAQVTMVATWFREEVKSLAEMYPINLIERPYQPSDLDGKDIVIAATDDPSVNRAVYDACRARNILANVADTPDICSFYLGGVVTKGHLKIAISTNGKSPTTAKRLRQFFEEVIPEDIHDMLINLHQYRKKLQLDFKQKVDHMNDLTQKLIERT
jgi:precorrin-2 dehydrogenase/sirohydrochlorin ferrochelatase